MESWETEWQCNTNPHAKVQVAICAQTVRYKPWVSHCTATIANSLPWMQQTPNSHSLVPTTNDPLNP